MKKKLTKKRIIIKLLQDEYINERVWWNLMGSKFKKSEIEKIDKTFRKCYKGDDNR
ncbi:MAG: hypothetical protein AB1349_12400 [Elusimicrobiota bacterium]